MVFSGFSSSSCNPQRRDCGDAHFAANMCERPASGLTWTTVCAATFFPPPSFGISTAFLAGLVEAKEVLASHACGKPDGVLRHETWKQDKQLCVGVQLWPDGCCIQIQRHPEFRRMVLNGAPVEMTLLAAGAVACFADVLQPAALFQGCASDAVGAWVAENFRTRRRVEGRI